MSLNQAVNIMQEIPLFRNVDPRQLKVIAMMGETRTYRAHEQLFEKGDEGDAAFVIIEGAVDVLVRVDDSERLRQLITISNGILDETFPVEQSASRWGRWFPVPKTASRISPHS